MTFLEHARAVSAFKGSGARRVKEESTETFLARAALLSCPPRRVCAARMSDVRLSNASPTVERERVDARQPDTVRSGARRALFNSKPDREEIRRYADASQRESVRDFKERFNFDPVTETPLPGGDYEWEVDAKAPEFYSRQPRRSHRPRRGEARDSPDDCEGEESRTRSESAPEPRGSRKRRPGASDSCSDCPNKRSKSDRDDDDDDDEEEDCAGGVVKTSSRSEDNQEVLHNAEH